MPKSTVYGGSSNKHEPVVVEAKPAELATEPEAAPEVEVVDLLEPEPGPEYGAWLIADLRKECERRGLPRSGLKDDLVARLCAADDAGI